mmetsp:Transcript_8380/g.7507  ORF Transcript_8380/g.7507 Transcript_8380/m.7507 type:complete len:185 (-) Transcript_8380:119-673(-)
MSFTDFFKKRICCLVTNPKRGITYAWLASLLLVFVAFIVACVAASNLAKKQTEGQNGFGEVAAFAAVWTALLLIAISVIGTVIMRRFQTPLAIGYFLGVIFIMVHQMLILFAIFVERSQHKDQPQGVRSSQEAMAVFSFFLFLVYAAFGSMLAVFRNDIIKEEVLGEDPDAQEASAHELPPEYK